MERQDFDGTKCSRLKFGDALSDLHDSRHEDKHSSYVRVGRLDNVSYRRSDEGVVDPVRSGEDLQRPQRCGIEIKLGEIGSDCSLLFFRLPRAKSRW